MVAIALKSGFKFEDLNKVNLYSIFDIADLMIYEESEKQVRKGTQSDIDKFF